MILRGVKQKFPSQNSSFSGGGQTKIPEPEFVIFRWRDQTKIPERKKFQNDTLGLENPFSKRKVPQMLQINKRKNKAIQAARTFPRRQTARKHFHQVESQTEFKGFRIRSTFLSKIFRKNNSLPHCFFWFRNHSCQQIF